MGNFIAERSGIVSICRELGINTIHAEDGFFPHYETMHVDPLGFSWESSLPRMIFRSTTQEQKEKSKMARENWLLFNKKDLPKEIKKPFVLWAAQLLGDKVNVWDLNVKSWKEMITHFRQSLPENFQLVIKPHPRGDSSELLDLTREFNNVVLLPKSVDLKTLLSECCGVAGSNSSVLLEARLMFRKPTYAYSRGWHTNHEELFLPMRLSHGVRAIPRIDYLENNERIRNETLDEYSDWFLANLLSRQLSQSVADKNPKLLKSLVDKFSYKSYKEYGEGIFL